MAEKRGVNIIKYGLIEDVDLPDNTYDHEYLQGAMPGLPYPIELAASGVWHSTEEKIDVLKNLGIKDFTFYQTLVKNPMYTNEEPEEVVEGYKSGGYVAIIAQK